MGKISKKNVLLLQPKFQISSIKIRFEPFSILDYGQAPPNTEHSLFAFRVSECSDRTEPTATKHLFRPRTANIMNNVFKTVKQGEMS